MYWDKYCSELLLTAEGSATAIAVSVQNSTKSITVPASQPCPRLQLCNLLAAHKCAQRILCRTRLSTDEWILRKEDSKLCRHSKCIQIKNWHFFCRSLSPFTSVPKMWRVTDLLCGKRRPSCSLHCTILAHTCSSPTTSTPPHLYFRVRSNFH